LASETDIWTLALSHIGADPVTLYDDPRKSATLCRRLYPSIRDAVLRAYPWRCARIQRSLAVLADAPSDRYEYGYSLPTDPYCLWVPKMLNEDLDYEVEGRNLLSNESTVTVTYIKRVTDPGLFDTLLIEAIAERLASTLAFPLTGIPTLGKELWGLYTLKLTEARVADSMEGTIPEYESNALTDVRR